VAVQGGKPTNGSWSWRTALGFSLAVIAVLAAAPATLVPWGARVHAAAHGWAQHSGGLMHQVAILAVPLAVCTLLVVAACLLPRPLPPTNRRIEFVPLALGGLLLLEPWLHLAVLALLAQHAWPGAGDMLLPRVPSNESGHWSLAVLLYLVISPVSEEFFFRGRLVPWLKLRLDAVSAVTLSALAFACAHGDACQVLVALPVGLLLGMLRVSGAGLLPCVLVHVCHNALFYIAGPTLVSEPWVGMALFLAGIGYLFLGLLWPGRQRLVHPARVILGCLVLTVVLAALQPWYRQVQQRCWLSAMHRVIAYGSLQDDILLARVDYQCVTDRISHERRAQLAQRLLQEPSPHADRQYWVLGRLDPASLATADDDVAGSEMASIASCPMHLPTHDDAVRRLALVHAGTFTRMVTEDPEILERWLPLPEQSMNFLKMLEQCGGWQRQQLLAAGDHIFPGLVTPVLLQLPPGLVTPTDRRFLFLHDAQAAQDIARLPPPALKAWSP
jgi:membrane protease YdiL (CAAX protease family)